MLVKIEVRRPTSCHRTGIVHGQLSSLASFSNLVKISSLIRTEEQVSDGVTKIVEIILKDFKGPILLNLNWRD